MSVLPKLSKRFGCAAIFSAFEEKYIVRECHIYRIQLIITFYRSYAMSLFIVILLINVTLKRAICKCCSHKQTKDTKKIKNKKDQKMDSRI